MFTSIFSQVSFDDLPLPVRLVLIPLAVVLMALRFLTGAQTTLGAVIIGSACVIPVVMIVRTLGSIAGVSGA